MKRSLAYKFCPECGKKYLDSSDQEKLICPNGHIYYISPKPTCSAIIKNKDRKILIVKRDRPPAKGLWETPGGFVSLNETLEEAITREIKEECGVEIKILSVLGGFPSTYKLNGVDYETYLTFVSAEILKGIPKPVSENSEVRFVALEELKNINFAFPFEKEQVEVFLRSSSN